MKLVSLVLFASALFGGTSAHYIFTNLNGNSAVVRQPGNNSPVEDVNSPNMRCNTPPNPASSVLTVAAGSTLTFGLDNVFYHQGPAAVYLARAPGDIASFDGSGSVWFKIAEWGATFNPFQFIVQNQNHLTFALPSSIPAGNYLVRAEQIGLHVVGAPQFYISCAQIQVTGGGSASPPTVSIPGYVSASDPSLTLNIYYPVPTSYRVPGPSVWQG